MHFSSEKDSVENPDSLAFQNGSDSVVFHCSLKGYLSHSNQLQEGLSRDPWGPLCVSCAEGLD
jgi:hypothetical protein